MADLIKNCDECELDECINCEHSWSDIQELKQLLAEKDKEIDTWKRLVDSYKEQCHQFLSNIDMCYERINKLKNQVNDYQQRFNSSEKKYKQLIQSGVECVNVKNKKQNQKAIEELDWLLKYISEKTTPNEEYSNDIVRLIKNRIAKLKGDNKNG